MAKLLLPQEIETFYVIPTIRKHLALEMRTLGMKVDDIASLLTVNKSAVSQYLNQKRGNKIVLDQQVIEKIKEVTPKIKDNFSYLKATQEILQFIRDNQLLCAVHKLFSNIPHNCNPKDIGCHRGGTCT